MCLCVVSKRGGDAGGRGRGGRPELAWWASSHFSSSPSLQVSGPTEKLVMLSFSSSRFAHVDDIMFVCINDSLILVFVPC